MCGGGYKAPPDNSVQVQREQQQYEDRRRQEQEAKDAAKEAQQRTTFTSARDAAATAAQNRATRLLRSRGLNPDDYTDVITQSIADQRALVPDLDPNPAGYFTADFVDDVLSGEQNNRRTQYTNQVNTLFPTNGDYNIFGDTADDDIITRILGEQRDGARRSVDTARQRGNLNQTGYDAALAELDKMYSGGLSQAQSLGGGVLSGYRTQLNSVAEEARNAAGNYTLGGTFDPTSYQQRYNRTADDLRGRLEGDVTSAVSGQNFFDLGDIITRGGNTQGATNPRTALTDVLAERERVRNTNRGVGTDSAGIF